MIKQAESNTPQVQTDGCLFLTLLKFAEDYTNQRFTKKEIDIAYKYAIPDYMKDDKHDFEDRCFILDHEAIIELGLRMLGIRSPRALYLFRRDGDIQKIGNMADIWRCNFYAARIKLPTFSHFYQSDQSGAMVWNPGISINDKITSIRGYKIVL